MINRRSFFRSIAAGALFSKFIFKVSLKYFPENNLIKNTEIKKTRLGIVGLSVHSAAFSKIINNDMKFSGCRVVGLYHPPGNPDVDFTDKQLAGFKKTIQENEIQIVESIDSLLKLDIDGVLIETNDGRPHFDEVKPFIDSGIPAFIDKPVAEDLKGVIKIFNYAKGKNVPIFSSSALRYGDKIKKFSESKINNNVINVHTYSPASLEKSHTDLYWYGIHGVEMLFTVMGTGCQEVMQVESSQNGDAVIGYWSDDRVGIFRGIRKGKGGFGGIAFLEDDIVDLGGFDGYEPLVYKIVEFFQNGVAPVSIEETLEIYVFMTAAYRSKINGGIKIKLSDIYDEFGIK